MSPSTTAVLVALQAIAANLNVNLDDRREPMEGPNINGPFPDDLQAWSEAAWQRIEAGGYGPREIALALATERDRCWNITRTMHPLRDWAATELRATIMDAIEKGYNSPYYRDEK